jgi:hypothetical protein
MAQDERAPAVATAGAKDKDDDSVNCQRHYTANTVRLQAATVAERSFDEFGGCDLLDAGLRATKRGWKIFPCNGKKEPLTAHGFKDATTNEQQIRAWAKAFPGGLWAYALPKEIVVIDLDLKHGNNGIKEFEILQHCKPDEFVAPRVVTATGGMHLYTNAGGQEFKNTKSVIDPGIDTRTSGGYVIIPSGPQAGYRWLSDPNTSKPPIPRWADAALRRESNFESVVNGRPYQGISHFGDIMLESACDAIRTAPGGKQEETLNGRSYQMGRFVGGGLLERDPTIGELIKAGLRMVDYDKSWEWTEKEIEDKVKRAIDAGMLKPDDDGTETDRRTQELLDRLFNDPQYAKEVEDTLERYEWAALEQKPEQKAQEPPKNPPKQEHPRQEQREQAKQKPDKLQERLASLTESAANLQHQTFPALQYVIPEIMPEGLTLLAGRPKVGKSFLCLDAAIAVSTGGLCLGKQCEQGDVLALFLEDSKRRIQRRIDRMIGVLKTAWPTRLRYATDFNTLDDGGLEMLYLWIKSVDNPRLIVVDLWERFRPVEKLRNGSQYRSDYADLVKLQKITAEFPRLGILVTNHQRKATADDVFDTISGTLGLNGGADTLMVLAREEGAKFLEVRGRDITDYAIVVEQDDKLRWRDVGDKHKGAATPERKKIVEVMRGKGPMTVDAIAKAVGENKDVIKNLLYKMHMAEVVNRVKWGSYVLPEQEKADDGGGMF